MRRSTELHELLAEAWEAAKGRDSAVAHYRVVADSWKRADPVLQPRRAHAEERLVALEPLNQPGSSFPRTVGRFDRAALSICPCHTARASCGTAGR